MTAAQLPLPFARGGYTEILWNERQEDSFAGMCRIAVPFEGADPVGVGAAENFLAGRWLRPGALSPFITITSVELSVEGRELVVVVGTDPPIDDRTFVGIRMARDLRAALRHARQTS